MKETMKEKRYLCDWKEGKSKKSIALIKLTYFLITILICGILSYLTLQALGLWIPTDAEYPEQLYEELKETLYEYIDEGKSFDYMGLQADPRIQSFQMYIHSDYTVLNYGSFYESVLHRFKVDISPDYHITSMGEFTLIDTWEHSILVLNLSRSIVPILLYEVVLYIIVNVVIGFSTLRKKISQKGNQK